MLNNKIFAIMHGYMVDTLIIRPDFLNNLLSIFLI